MRRSAPARRPRQASPTVFRTMRGEGGYSWAVIPDFMKSGRGQGFGAICFLGSFENCFPLAIEFSRHNIFRENRENFCCCKEWLNFFQVILEENKLLVFFVLFSWCLINWNRLYHYAT